MVSERTENERTESERTGNKRAEPEMAEPKTENIIVLASLSPRRNDILKRLEIPFITKPQNIDETVAKWKLPESVKELAEKKLKNALTDSSLKNMRWFLAADTIVSCGKRIIGKPSSAKDAEEFLKFLSGKEHKVITALALFDRNSGKIIVKDDTTSVFFSKMGENDIKWYVSTEEWVGAAGGYRIQGKGEFFISHIKGSYSNVMGLPINLFFSMLYDAGYPVYKSSGSFHE